jgi:hypothetical protein
MNQPSASNKIPFEVEFTDGTSALLMWDGSFLTGLSGDYNADGIVDTADYIVWRKGGSKYTSTDYTSWRNNFGAFTSPANGDFNHDGAVNSADYVVWRKSSPSGYTPADYNAWRAHFGQSAGGASVAAAPVPEPSAGILVVGTVFFLALPCRRTSL